MPVAGEVKAGQAAARLPYIASLVRAGSFVKGQVAGVLKGSAIWTGGKIARALPVDLGVTRRVADVAPERPAQRVVGQASNTLERTPLPEQLRLRRLVDGADLDLREWMAGRLDSDRLPDTLDTLRRTGADGRDVLESLDDAARGRLVRLEDGLQRRVTSAADELQPQQVDDFLEWYEGRTDAVKGRINDFSQRYGPDWIELFSRSDDDARELMTDGGEIADDLARAADEIDDLDDVAQDDLWDSLDELDDVSDVRHVDGGVEIDGQRHGSDVTVTYSDEGVSFYTGRSSDVDSRSDLQGMDSQEIGAQVVEGDVANDLIEQRDGYEIVYGQQKAGNAQGIDVIARDTSGQTDEFVVIEVKFTSQDERLSMDAFGERTFGGRTFGQMEDGWVEGSYENDIVADSDVRVPDDLDAAMTTENYRKEVFVVQDGQTGAITSESVATLADEITIVKTNGVTK